MILLCSNIIALINGWAEHLGNPLFSGLVTQKYHNRWASAFQCVSQLKITVLTHPGIGPGWLTLGELGGVLLSRALSTWLGCGGELDKVTGVGGKGSSRSTGGQHPQEWVTKCLLKRIYLKCLKHCKCNTVSKVNIQSKMADLMLK